MAKSKAGTHIENCTFTTNSAVAPESIEAVMAIAAAVSECAKALQKAAEALRGADHIGLQVKG